MREPNQETTDVTPRRGFFGRIAAMSVLGLSGFATAAARAETGDGPEWPGTLKGRHKQVFDVYDINEGSPLGFANNFLTPNESATAVLVFRHKGLPFAMDISTGISSGCNDDSFLASRIIRAPRKHK